MAADARAPTRGEQPRLVGQALPRIEDPPLLTGNGRFVADLVDNDTLEVAYVRSSQAHARILSVDTGAAAELDGVVAVVSAADLDVGPLEIPLDNPDAVSPPRPLLATSVVRFVGEPVAAVLAESRYLAEDAAELVEIEYEELEPLPDIAAALAESAPRLHDHPSNVLFDSTTDSGGVEEAFAAAEVVVERVFRNPRYSAAPIEGRGLIVEPSGHGLRLHCSTQVPHRVAELLAEILGLEPSQVRVLVPDVGGGFGQKAHVYPEEVITGWLALRHGRRVAWIEDRSENLLASSHAREQELRVRLALASDGQILALDADVLCDQGAYGVYSHAHILEALGTPSLLPGPYRVPAYRARARTVMTNKCPSGAYRGVGMPVATFVHERLMDIAARALGIDRAEIRRRNLLRADELPHITLTGHRYDSGDYASALELALDRVGYASFSERRAAARRAGRLLGLGLASFVEYTASGSVVFRGRGMIGVPGYDGAHVALDDQGAARLWTTLPTLGQGSATTFVQIVADALSIDPSSVAVEQPDTTIGDLNGSGTFGSRSAVIGGGAIEAAAAELRGRLLDAAAARLEVAAGDLELRDGHVGVRGASTSTVSIGELVAVEPARYRASEHCDPPAAVYPYATHACIVEVDPETGGVAIERYVVVEDCGTRINPTIVDGQAHGATAQGIGGALYEAISYDEHGQLRTASLVDYLLPTATELPTLELAHLETPASDSPNGAKGAGESGTLGPPPALANAVADAMGVEMNELPLTPERVLRALERRRG